MESSSVKILSVHPDLEEEWDSVNTTDEKAVLKYISTDEIFGCSKVEGVFISPDKSNCFAEAARIAYQYHLPISFSPDQVWLAIA